MRAPMCYVLAVVLRIILFSVSMGFPINLKSTPARSASINRPNSRERSLGAHIILVI